MLGLHHLLDWFAPPSCAACAMPTRPERAFCPGCAATIMRAEDEPDALQSPFCYGGALASAIVRWKFHDALGVGTTLAQLFATELAPRLPRGSVLVPVPSHPLRLAERGFNPPTVLARALAQRGGFTVAHWLHRHRDTPQQSLQTATARREQLRGAFRATIPKHATLDRAIWLIDDVSTTGSTLRACRVALRAAGCVVAAAATLAQAPRQRSVSGMMR